MEQAAVGHSRPVDQHDVAVDIGGTSWLVGRWDGGLRVLGRGLVGGRPAGTMAEIAAVLAAARAAVGPGRRGPAGPPTAGCSFAGAVDRIGQVDAWPSRPGWIGFPLRAALAAALRGSAGQPAGPPGPTQPTEPTEPTEPTVSIEDDGYCAALGESRLGVARGEPDHLTLTLGTGIGGAWTVGGRVRRPVAAGARTIGHLRALGPDRPCRCGSAGCLQTVLADVTGRAADADPPDWAAGDWAAGRRFVEVVADLVQATGLTTVVLTGGLTGLPWLTGFLRHGFDAEGVTCLIPRCGDRSSLLGATIRAA